MGDRASTSYCPGCKRESHCASSCVGGLPPRVAEFIESELITKKGFRNSFARDDAVPSRLTENELARLIESRLVRSTITTARSESN